LHQNVELMNKTILFIIGVVLLFASCEGGKSVRHIVHLGNTPYQQDTILVTYATNPERALVLLDSALLLGNISDYRAQFIRAKIFSKSLKEQRQDSAISICQLLLNHDSVRNVPDEQANVLDMLIAASRARQDYEQYLKWATQKAELCRNQGEEIERWRTEADLGLVMTHLGQVDEGLRKLDEAIKQLDAPGSIDRMDAFVVAVKRKINALNDLGGFAEVIALGQRTLDRLDHYEQHAADYAEDSYRLSWSDNPNDRDRYLDFSRAQAWGFMAHAYSQLNDKENAWKYLALFDQSNYGHTFMARRMIAPTQMALGLYDDALTTYAEIERRMAADTVNDEYAVVLRSKALAARAKGHIAEALDYQVRYANLSKVLNDSLHKSEAHDYAARYHAQEQQLEIMEKHAEAQRSRIVSWAVTVVALLAIAFALYFFRQKRIIAAKNHALVRMINEENQRLPITPNRTANPSDEIFSTIDAAIREEQLYVNQQLQRQDICDRFGISRHALNDLLALHAEGLSFPQYINAIRINEAIVLLKGQPDMTVTAIAKAVGFTPSNFREQFKQKYGITPQEYRQNT